MAADQRMGDRLAAARPCCAPTTDWLAASHRRARGLAWKEAGGEEESGDESTGGWVITSQPVNARLRATDGLVVRHRLHARGWSQTGRWTAGGCWGLLEVGLLEAAEGWAADERRVVETTHYWWSSRSRPRRCESTTDRVGGGDRRARGWAGTGGCRCERRGRWPSTRSFNGGRLAVSSEGPTTRDWAGSAPPGRTRALARVRRC